MAYSQELRMVFKTEGDKLYSLVLTNPRDDLSQTEVEEAMDIILEKDVVLTNSGGLTDKVKAYMVDRTITTLLP